MTISDIIAQLTRIMGRDRGGLEVRICNRYDSMEETFDAFYVINPIDDRKKVYLVPTSAWMRKKKEDVK